MKIEILIELYELIILKNKRNIQPFDFIKFIEFFRQNMNSVEKMKAKL